MNHNTPQLIQLYAKLLAECIDDPEELLMGLAHIVPDLIVEILDRRATDGDKRANTFLLALESHDERQP